MIWIGGKCGLSPGRSEGMKKKEKRVVEEKVIGKQDRMGRLFVAIMIVWVIIMYISYIHNITCNPGAVKGGFLG